MLRGTARLVLPDTGRQTERGRKWKRRRSRSCCCNQLNICSDSIWPGYCSWAYSTLPPLSPAVLGISLVAPQNPRTIAAAYPLSAPLHCAPLHRSGTCAHNFCQRCKRAELKLITLKSFIKKVYFLLAHGTGQQSPHHSPYLSLSLFYGRKREHSKTVANLEPQDVSCCLLSVSYLPLLCLFLFIWPAHC